MLPGVLGSVWSFLYDRYFHNRSVCRRHVQTSSITWWHFTHYTREYIRPSIWMAPTQSFVKVWMHVWKMSYCIPRRTQTRVNIFLYFLYYMRKYTNDTSQSLKSRHLRRRSASILVLKPSRMCTLNTSDCDPYKHLVNFSSSETHVSQSSRLGSSRVPSDPKVEQWSQERGFPQRDRHHKWFVED